MSTQSEKFANKDEKKDSVMNTDASSKEVKAKGKAIIADEEKENQEPRQTLLLSKLPPRDEFSSSPLEMRGIGEEDLEITIGGHLANRDVDGMTSQQILFFEIPSNDGDPEEQFQNFSFDFSGYPIEIITACGEGIESIMDTFFA